MATSPPFGFRLLHADDRLLVLDKPSGLLAVPGRGPDKQDCLTRRVQTVYAAARVVHRLDRDTSGVFLMALDEAAQVFLGRQFEERQVSKHYQAVVAGIVQEDQGCIVAPLRKDFDHPPRHMVDPLLGRPAETFWQVTRRDADRTWLALQPRTGRSHQLRVHLRHIGHPILGDPLYAPPDVLVLADRLLLHAERLTILHPATGEPMTFSAPCELAGRQSPNRV